MQANIVLITVDCWRGDHIGCADKPKAATPNINLLANKSSYFNNAYTCGGWTKIAMTTLFSSTYASMYGFSKNGLSPERPMLAEELSKHNYQTAGFTTNVVCGSPQGFDRGFHTFEDAKPERDAPYSQFKFPKLEKIRGFQRLAKYPLFHSVLSSAGIDTAPQYPTLPANELVDKALHWLDNERNKEQPYFLWLHFMDLHMPYRSSLRKKTGKETCEMRDDSSLWNVVKKSHGTHYNSDEKVQRWKQLYAEETEYLDQQLGRLFTDLEARDDWDQTALCLTADHGEEFYEHGTWGHSWNQLFDEGTNVPLVFRTPGQTRGKKNNQMISHVDIAPTLLDIAGATPPQTMLGKSRLNELQPDSPIEPSEDALYTEMHSHFNSYRFRLSIIYKAHRYIYDGETDSCQLYCLTTDPDATKNLYDKALPIVTTFDQLRLKHITKGALAALKGNIELSGDAISYDLDDDPAVVERLRALGYME